MMKFTAAQKHHELIREVADRRRAYPHMIKSGAITRETAESRMAMLSEVADEYRFQVQTEALIGQIR